MADISIEIAAIQTATQGSTLRSAIAAALVAINNDIPPVYSGSYSLLPSTVSYTVSVSGFRMAQDLVVEAYPEPILISKVITENGTYHASSDNADGYSQVTVSIPYYGGPYSITPSTVSQTFYTTDLMMAQDLVVEAYPEPVLISKVCSYNSVYWPGDDNADGYSLVIVSIPSYSGSYEITPDNTGIWLSTDGCLLESNIYVRPYSAALMSKTVDANGTYYAYHEIQEVDGYSEFTVAIPEYSGPYVITPSTVSQTFPTAGKLMTQDVTVEAYEDRFEYYFNLELRSFSSDIVSLRTYAFQSQSLLTYVSLPKCKALAQGAFYACRTLPEIYLPKCETILTSAFTGCYSLSTVRFDVLSNIAGGGHFRACSALTSLYLLWSSVCSISAAASASMFSSTPIMDGTGFIYVPSSLYSAYINHSVWGTWSSAFRSYTE